MMPALLALWAVAGCDTPERSSAPPAPAVETCDNGRDDDRNGLVDCEDAGCADACTPDCDAPDDRDQNGILDATDLGCRAPASAGLAATAQVLGGGAVTRTRTTDEAWGWGSGTYIRETELADHVFVSEVWGELRVGPVGGAATTTCTWSAESVSFTAAATERRSSFTWTTSASHSTQTAGAVQRAAVTVSPGCPVGSSALPIAAAWTAGGHAQATWAGGDTGPGWYQADMPLFGETLASSSSRTRHPSSSDGHSHREVRFEGTLGAGNPVTVGAP